MSKSQEANDAVEAMRSLSFLFNAFIMMQVGGSVAIRMRKATRARPSRPGGR